jgi:hypothetical protein
MSVEQRYATIVRTLAGIKEHDLDFTVFGSEAHKYGLRPCLSEQEVQEFESKHNVRLPEEYRGFLLTVGNGGAGPCYGLFSLGVVVGNSSKDLASPFPHRDRWNPADEFFRAHPNRFENSSSKSACREFESEYCSTRQIQGSVPISHQGCGYMDLLVVSGPARGQIWTDDRVADGGINPLLTADGNRMNFLDWYSNWLDESLQTLGLNPKN